MPSPDQLAIVYASDENIAIRATGDFVVLCPEWQKLAYAKDGVFASDDPWTLTSATVDFEAQGVKPDQIVSLTQPKAAFKGSGEQLVVDSVAGSSVTLRRVGMASGVGHPPGGSAGLTGVEFAIHTMAPQIEEASFQLNRQFGIDNSTPCRTANDLYDLRDLRESTVLKVLAGRYAAETRTERGDFPAKRDDAKAQLADALSKLSIRFACGGDTVPTEVGVAFMRIVR